MFENPLVNRAWTTFEIDKGGKITTILNVEPKSDILVSGDVEGDLANAITEFMTKHTEIDRAIVLPRAQ